MSPRQSEAQPNDQVSFYRTGDAAQSHEKVARSLLCRLVSPDSFKQGRIFVAAFDGTCNSLYSVPTTNVAKLAAQIASLKDPRMCVHYVPGPGTQCDFVRKAFDSTLCYSFEWRVHLMRAAFVAQMARWGVEGNGKCTGFRVHVLSIGFSRGCALAVAFSRSVDAEGLSSSQAVGLFDPVCTGVPRLYDRRLPPSVKCGMQITAIDEKRDMFVSSSLIDDGLSRDDRFLNVRMKGAHCDVGGGYVMDGLAKLSMNLMIEFINSSFCVSLEEMRNDPKQSLVIHRSEEHMCGFYSTRQFDKAGERQRLASSAPTQILSYPSFYPIILNVLNTSRLLFN
jgi:uncharacterized protein (DUF2235 family)